MEDVQGSDNLVRVLDEVTTHVDAPTVRGLGKALRAFKGAIILVTHDR
jgi:ATP-binding cassette subfamily F protein 3